MFKQILNVWQNNHGTILATCGAIVAIFMSLAWRMDLLPDISPAMSRPATLLGGRPKAQPSTLVVTITSEDPLDADVTLQLFSPSQVNFETLSPIATQTVKMQNGFSEFVVTELSRGVFAGLAYIDTNDNSVCDLDGEGLPVEPFGMVSTKPTDASKRLPEGVFEIGAEPQFIKIHLHKPSTQAGESASTTDRAR